MLCVNKEVFYNPISTYLAKRHRRKVGISPQFWEMGVMVGVYQRFNFSLSIKKTKMKTHLIFTGWVVRLFLEDK